jgi:hypothetical protein
MIYAASFHVYIISFFFLHLDFIIYLEHIIIIIVLAWLGLACPCDLCCTLGR